MNKDEALAAAEAFVKEHHYARTHDETVRLVAMAMLHGEQRGLAIGAEIAERAFAALREDMS